MNEDYRARVRDYYDQLTPLILKDVGYTYQAGTLIKHQGNAYNETNIYLAERAGIRSGMRVLDAGCGACGPAVDIAKHVNSVTIDALTVSEIQAKAARAHVDKHNLGDRIRVSVGDYHHTSFADETFDLVYFFESSGYSEDPALLFREVFRILKPGGTLYIKDVFCYEPPYPESQAQALRSFNELWRFQTQTLRAMVTAASASGFVEVESANLGSTLGTDEIPKATTKFEDGKPVLSESGVPVLTDFGALHPSIPEAPVFFGELKARRP
jgi:cyclopropane fatty-acyl-phospholipid synthase-like methyltransferase